MYTRKNQFETKKQVLDEQTVQLYSNTIIMWFDTDRKYILFQEKDEGLIGEGRWHPSMHFV